MYYKTVMMKHKIPCNKPGFFWCQHFIFIKLSTTTLCNIAVFRLAFSNVEAQIQIYKRVIDIKRYLIFKTMTCCVSSPIFPGIRRDDSPQLLLACGGHQNKRNVNSQKSDRIQISCLIDVRINRILMFNIVEIIIIKNYKRRLYL